MPIISVPQLDKKISCNPGETLMGVLQKNEVPVASSCLGDGICGKCLLEVNFHGEPSLPTELETKLINKHNWLKLQRASCQIIITSDLSVRSTYW